MKLFGCLLAGIVSLLPVTTYCLETARATVFCYSLQFQRGQEPLGNFYLDLTSVPGQANGELAPDFFNSGYSHSAYLSLIDELLGETFSGQLALDVPDGDDLNHDGFPDFFQTCQGISNQVSAGAYRLDFYGDGSATATWNRSAGSKDGWCALTIKLTPFQTVTLSLPFEILEFSGPLQYSAASQNISGIVALVQTGNTNNVLKGITEFAKAQNQFNELTLQAGTWTNQVGQTLKYVSHLISREEAWPTNYYGYLEFAAQNSAATRVPYALWLLSIDDINDADHDGIPDFSDDSESKTLPRIPRLECVPSATKLTFTVHGDVGHAHELQEISALHSNYWQKVLSVILTNDPQIISVPLPAGSIKFWRVKAT